MIVFPESLNKIDTEDTQKSLQVLENYINYMCERVDHSVNNMTNNLASQGDIAPYTMQKLEEMMTIVSQMSSSVNAVVGKVTGLTTSVDEIEKSVSAINNSITDIEKKISNAEDKIQAIENNLSDISDKVSEIEEDISDIDNKIVALDERVKALEGEIPEEGGIE